MSKKKYVVRLTEEERAYLRTLIGRGTASARTMSRARLLLKANQGEKAERPGPTPPPRRLWKWAYPPSRGYDSATSTRDRRRL